ncbi:MAG: hypothetical protein Q9160_002107 [Pyrenula sp. 1 TL-2023]
MKVKGGKVQRFDKDPRSNFPPPDSDLFSKSMFLASSPEVSPTDQKTSAGGFGNHRKALAVLGADSSGSPTPARGPPSIQTDSQIAPWEEPSSRPKMQAHPYGHSFYNDSSENMGQLSPGCRPGTSRTGTSESGYEGDTRRPSVASNATVSSHGSKTSAGGRLHKNLKGFFGHEYGGHDLRLASDPTVVQHGSEQMSRESSKQRHRTDSIKTNHTSDSLRPPSPGRPHTPLPASDVTPWMYQNFTDVSQFGEAPVRQAPIGPDSHRYGPNAPAPNQKDNHHHHRVLPHFHRHTRSKEETSKKPDLAPTSYPTRPTTSREHSFSNPSYNPEHSVTPSPMSSTSFLAQPPRPRASSPTPSGHSNWDKDGPSDSRSGGKRSLLDKIRRHKGQQNDLKNVTNAKGAPSDGRKPLPPEPSPRKTGREGSVATVDSGYSVRHMDTNHLDKTPTAASKATSMFGRHHGKRGFSYESNHGGRDRQGSQTSNMFALDTDLNDMEGIISKPSEPLSPNDAPFMGLPDDKRQLNQDAQVGVGAWDAPDSWAVKRAGDDLVAKLPEIHEDGLQATEEDDGTPYCMRVFRIDSTFATISSSVNSTVADILQLLAKKSVLQDSIESYQLVLKKHDLQRALDLGERPIVMQKKLLEQVGYQTVDRIEEIGREDNSYLCRFTFTHAKMTGFYSLDKDPGFSKMAKFSHVDLQGRSLVTIPITLYQKASEIISLNLSRNLALDVPKDFIQACINLRELKFTACESWRLPSSLSYASRLTVIDISNNRLQQLEHAELDRLSGLVSIKMANNKLSHLPPYFGKFKHLRNLNMCSNSFTEFPDFLCDLKSLVDLDISFNQITDLPKIDKLTNLERLWMTNNNLTGPFPDSFRKLVNLKEIDARFNGITNVDKVCQLPRLELLLVGHNGIVTFNGSFVKVRTLVLDHCPITQFDLDAPVPSLTTLNIASAKLVQLKDSTIDNMPNLTKLILDKNHFTAVSTHISKVAKLEHLSMAKNPLNFLPPTIGALGELKHLNLRECNCKALPPELWYCAKLETLNVSANILESFPKQGAAPPPVSQPQVNGNTQILASSPSFEELGKLEDFGRRRPSNVSGGSLLHAGASPGGSQRKGSVVSIHEPGGRKGSVASRATNDGSYTPIARKDSNLSQNRLHNTFAGSLKYLYLADNRLEDEVYRELVMLPELRILNLSYNDLTDFPQGLLRRWPQITELYLSGNEISSLPSDDLEESSNIRVLHLNGNRFQVLPAELCKVHKLAILDVGSNSLKYNVSNWPYDWNWNWNRNLRYLNFSGNKRLEIKPSTSYNSAANNNGKAADLTNFNALGFLRVLGLMDVTLTINSSLDESEDKRVRTSASAAGPITYGMADSLGKSEHVSLLDMFVPNFRGDNNELLVGMFDGQPMSSSGSKVAKYLHESFRQAFTDELQKVQRENDEAAKLGSDFRVTPMDAMRRAFLALNKDIATAANQSIDARHAGHGLPNRTGSVSQVLSHDDLNSGGVATVMYLQNTNLYVANVGDAQVMLIQSGAQHRFLTQKHDPANPRERERIRDAGGYVSRQGRLNDVLEVSRAFGYFPMMPSVTAAPHTMQISLTDSDEMVLLASGEFWDFITPDLAVDIARQEKNDLMIAAQKCRDLAIAFGASNKIMVQLLGVNDVRKRGSSRYRGTSLSLTASHQQDENQIFPSKRGRRARDGVGDSRLARLEEPDAPVGDVAIVFTDIKSSTAMWEILPVAMRSAIQMHNDLFRRQLRLIGGYEVKTEGDAFMVSFPTVTSALLWCFSCQSHLLELPWPTEILDTVHCQEKFDSDGNVIFRGLSVRMGIHWGEPVSEKDPITRRMDYFGPMVNRASRISAVADGGQITVSSDFIEEIRRTLEAYADSDRSNSTGSDEAVTDDNLGANIRRELRQLSSQGFEVKDLGEKKLKGLENPEFVYLMYPHSLAGRLAVMDRLPDEGGNGDTATDRPGQLSKDTKLSIEPESVWNLWDLALRLEMLCSAFEQDTEGSRKLHRPEMSLLNQMRNQGGEITDEFFMNLLDHQVTRIENCITTLQIRALHSPFKRGNKLADHINPIGEVLSSVMDDLAAFQEWKATREQRQAREAQYQAMEQHFRTLEEEEEDDDSS